MKISQAIVMLKSYGSMDDEICISWWSKDLFDDDDNHISRQAWDDAVGVFDAEEGFDWINGQMYETINDLIVRGNK